MRFRMPTILVLALSSVPGFAQGGFAPASRPFAGEPASTVANGAVYRRAVSGENGIAAGAYDGASGKRMTPAQGQASAAAGNDPGNANRAMVVTAAPYGAKCDGATDDTVAIQAAANAAGSQTPALFPYLGGTQNVAQGVVQLPANATCVIRAAINLPPGVRFDLNHATLKMTGTGDAIDIVGTGRSWYGSAFNAVVHGNIEGPGSSISSGSGIFMRVASFGFYEDLNIYGFKFGLQNQEGQYNTFSHVYTNQDVVGNYQTARPDATNLAALDDTFTDVIADNNAKYGFWFQALSSSIFDRVDAGRNGEADIVFGAQLGPYIPSNGLTITGGSGCRANSFLPLTISDSTGRYAQGYVVTNASGIPTGAYMYDGGQGYTAPTFSLADCTTQPTITAKLVNDAGLGAWDGLSNIVRGGVTLNTIKSEGIIGQTENSGFAVVINGGANTNGIRGVTFNNYEFDRQSGGNPSMYFRLAFVEGFNIVFNNPYSPSDVFSVISNPTNPSDVSIFQGIAAQGLVTRWSAGTTGSAASAALYTVDGNGAVSYGWQQSYEGFAPDGRIEGLGFQARSNWGGAIAIAGVVTGKNYPQFQCTVNGLCSWSDGGKAGNEGTLQMVDNRLYLNGSQLNSTSLGDFSATAPKNGQVPTWNAASGRYVPTTPSGGAGSPQPVNLSGLAGLGAGGSVVCNPGYTCNSSYGSIEVTPGTGCAAGGADLFTISWNTPLSHDAVLVVNVSHGSGAKDWSQDISAGGSATQVTVNATLSNCTSASWLSYVIMPQS